MKKKLFGFGLVMVLFLIFLTSCEKKDREYGFQPVFEKLTWGMSMQEVIQSMELTKKNATIVEPKEDSVYRIIRLNEPYEEYGMNAMVHLLIMGKVKGAKESYPYDVLSAVVLQYSDIDYSKLAKNMNEQLGEAEIHTTDDMDTQKETYIWKSKDTIDSLYRTEKKELQAYCKNLTEEGYSALEPKETSAMNKITLEIDPENKKATVTYYGDWSLYLNISKKQGKE
ncbi:hypothetical protein [Anaerosporobacter faecicola]|uniref:hypothetical protein n=1 Tax=Anaerosporobacter faecicola TaxID=2718714 RepID=UPI00143B09B0|nr:hypothetical protein [Anaerosporobacter faecicola]